MMGASKVDGKIYGENSKFYGLKMFEKRMGGNMMNDTLVQSFLSVAAEGSFCKATEKIYISQPNLSRNIARLEKELNVQLFDRSGKHIALTEAGRIYQNVFQKVEQCMADAKERVERLEALEMGMIRIGYVNGWNIGSYIQPILKKLRLEYPGVKVSLEAYNLQELSARFQMGQLDLIITLEERAAKIYDAQTFVIDTAPEVILFSNTLFRNKKKNWKPEDFRKETFFVLADDREDMQAEYIRTIGSKYGFVPNFCSVNSMESILMNVENGLGVTVCNSWVRNVYTQGFQCCPLEHSVQIAAAWKQPEEQSVLNILLAMMTGEASTSCKIIA